MRSSRRSAIAADIFCIADSCGWSIPIYEYVEERDQQLRYASLFDEEGLLQEHRENCARSIEGLIGVNPDL